MNLIRLEGAGKDFGLRPLFRDLDLHPRRPATGWA